MAKHEAGTFTPLQKVERRASSSAESAEAACVGLSGGTEPCGGDAVCLDQSGLRNLAFCSFLSLFVSSLSTKD